MTAGHDQVRPARALGPDKAVCACGPRSAATAGRRSRGGGWAYEAMPGRQRAPWRNIGGG